MSTTTIRLGDLKERVSAAAEQAGKSTHAYILDAISASVTRDEQRAQFVAAALARRAQVLATGRTVPFEDMQAYARASVTQERAVEPRARRKNPATGR